MKIGSNVPCTVMRRLRGAGCSVSKVAADRIQDIDSSSLQEQLVVSLLEDLLSAPAAVLPIQPHSKRVHSGDRGVSLAFLRGVRTFYGKHGGLDKHMGDVCKKSVCKKSGSETSVCALTRCTGLSLAESVLWAAARRGVDASALVGRASSFFSYSWTGTQLKDMLAAIDDQVSQLGGMASVGGGVRERRVWVDMFCASQNLLAGKYLEPAITKAKDPVGYAARKEDTDNIFASALDAIDEVFFYFSPMEGEWFAPEQPFLLPDRGAMPEAEKWLRTGPGALTRAWCLMELATALAKGCKLYVLLSPADHRSFAREIQEDTSLLVKGSTSLPTPFPPCPSSSLPSSSLLPAPSFLLPPFLLPPSPPFLPTRGREPLSG